MNPFHMFPAMVDKYRVRPRHLVHVGAHVGQEIAHYRRAGIRKVTLVEPVPELANQLRRDFPTVDVIQKACSSDEGWTTFYVYKPNNLSSLLPPEPPNTLERTFEVETTTVERLCDSLSPAPNILVVDAQGSEMEVIFGADLRIFDMVIVETCSVGHFAAHHDYIVDFMEANGFNPVYAFTRDFDDVARWAYGPKVMEFHPKDEIRDVVFIPDRILENWQ